MSSPVVTNVFAPTAAHLRGQHNLTDEDRLFKEAIDNVKTKRKSISSSKDAILTRFETARNPQDFLNIFQDCRDQNDLLQPQTIETKTHKLARATNRFLAVKAFGDSATIANQLIAAPVWGVLCAALQIVQSILKLGEKLDQICKRLTHCIKLYDSLFKRRVDQVSGIRDALIQFTSLVVEFAVSIGALMLGNKKQTWTFLADKSFAEELDRLTLELEVTTQQVHEAINIDTNQQITNIRQAYALPPVRLTPTGGQNYHVYRVPDMRSTTFTGRVQELLELEKMLRDQPQFECQKCALVGVGGVGKTQLVLQYLYDKSKMHYQHVLYVRASSKATIQDEYAQLAEELGLCNNVIAGPMRASILQRLKTWLRSNQSWILVFDDVTDSADVLQYLPGGLNGHIIFTTRNQIAAEALVVRGNIIQLGSLPDATGVELVFNIARVSHPSPPDRVAALEIAKFAKGLPLAIEQVVKLGIYQGLDWRNVLQSVSEKFSLLQQQNFASNHERGMSIGAIIAVTLDSLKAHDSKALALFKLLVYLSPSSIPISLLYDAKKNLHQYFSREHTFYKGQLRSREEMQRINQYEKERKQTFCLWDYDPFKSDIYKKILRLGIYHPRIQNTTLPRSDSSLDVELQTLWTAETFSLQAALQDNAIISDTLVKLETLGLIRRLNNRSTIWIHDLFAELTQAVIELESTRAHQNIAHAAATMVFLALPLSLSRTKRKSIALWPHALHLHDKLRSLHMLNSSTVGPELSHLIACAIPMMNEYAKTEQSTKSKRIVYYLEHAMSGYFSAWKRLQETPGVTEQQIILSTCTDYALERIVTGYSPVLHARGCQRFGRSAPWRCLQTMIKLASELSWLQQSDRAITLVESAVSMAEVLFGFVEMETLYYVNLLYDLRFSAGDWEGAYIVARKLAEARMRLPVTSLAQPFCTSNKEFWQQAQCPCGVTYDLDGKLFDTLEGKNAPRQTSNPGDSAQTEESGTTRTPTIPKIIKLPFRPFQHFLPATLRSSVKYKMHAMLGIGAPKRVAKLEFNGPPSGLVDTFDGADLAIKLGSVTRKIEGKEQESLFCYRLALKALELFYGVETRELIWPMRQYSEACVHAAESYQIQDGENPAAVKLLQCLQDSDFHCAIYWAMSAVRIAMQGSQARAGGGGPIRSTTYQERIKAGEVLWDGELPLDEDARARINEWHREQMRDQTCEETIEHLRSIEARIPIGTLDNSTMIHLEILNVHIEEWNEEQAYWQAKVYVPTIYTSDGAPAEKHQIWKDHDEEVNRIVQKRSLLIST